ncbi:MAG TPA: aldo/keto reductase [Acidimicrobiales bacterium]|nr:aldo/keto reductase [Acidimicrobiales bacterium]
METKRIGSLEVSLVGLGCNNFGGRIDEARTNDVVRAALDAGITLFDTADIYGGGGASEELLGRALGSRRDEVVLATKFGMEMPNGSKGGAPAYVRAACEASLQRLGTEVIDLYQLHTPDDETPIADTLDALDELVREGKVREIGCSNLSAAQADEAMAASQERGLARFVVLQNELSLLKREGERDIDEMWARHGLPLLPYFPLASGLLTGKYSSTTEIPEGTRLASVPAERRQKTLNEANLEIVERLRAFAEDRGHTLLELAISWLASMDNVASVIAGATRPEQVHANVAAAGWILTPDERAEIDVITQR